MKIAATSVSMDAARTYREVDQRFTGLSMGTAPAEISGQTDLFGIRLAAMLASSTQTELTCRSEVSQASGDSTTLSAGGTKETGTEATLAQLAGQVIGQPLSIRASEVDETSPAPFTPLDQAVSPLLSVRTANLVSGTFYSQEESLLFAAQGTVQTTDGREIAFDLGLSMERSTMAFEYSAVEVSSLFIDPLILQFDLDSPLLGDSTFLFDLDSDGAAENLACPGSGCGFLAFDRNNDGAINNGLELFGPESGSGFGELAELDTDANQWIDENDPIFNQLFIWRPDGQGGETLMSLQEAGVGAISVLHAGTGFQLEKADGTILGTIKASGVFLTEDGEVRSLQEVDLALPGTQADIGTSGFHSSSHRLEAAMESLRDIISMQRLRLRMMLTGERLRNAVAKKEDPQDFLFNWLHARSEWQTQVEGGLGERNGLDPAEVVAPLAWKGRQSGAEKSS
jgi:hypothetical protein